MAMNKGKSSGFHERKISLSVSEYIILFYFTTKLGKFF